MSAEDLNVGTNLNSAIRNLEAAIAVLMEKAEVYYAAGDNMRGNIRFDAAARLSADLDRLVIARDYIVLAMAK
jgi:hypothetical protein